MILRMFESHVSDAKSKAQLWSTTRSWTPQLPSGPKKCRHIDEIRMDRWISDSETI